MIMKNIHKNNNMKICEGLKLGKGSRRDPVCPQTTSELIRYINSLDNDDFIDVGNVDISNLTSLKGVFQYLNVKEIRGLQNWNVSKITDFSILFTYCDCLEDISGIENWDTKNATNMKNMFFGCENLTTINISNWDLSKVTDITRMFSACSQLTDIIGVDKLKPIYEQYSNQYIFKNCPACPDWAN